MTQRKPQVSDLGCIPDLNSEEQAAYEVGLAVRADAEARAPGWVARTVDVALNTNHGFPRGEARIALQLGPAEEVVAALLPALLSANKRMRRRSMTLLPRLDPDEVCRQLDPVLESGERNSRRAACVALAAIGAPASALLERLTDDPDGAIRNRARRALDAIAARPPDNDNRNLSYVRPFGLPYRDAPPPRPESFAVAAFNFSYGVNLGTLVRSAEAAGAESVWIIGRDFYYRPSTKGTDWWLPVETFDSVNDCLARAVEEGFEVVALQQGSKAQPVWEAEWPQRPLIVAGNEGDGLPSSFVDAAVLQLELPVFGQIDSLNVAVATSVAMYAFRGWQARQQRT
ncbi:MAG: HEAT repeat domain-containing protein [Chloroflexi bacterium]|nr:HEAT repeat domain-containing protein [Chloroflexota bacterium]MCY3695845.1 HEAT repeat domain-containing protein [Chloroflexota bacterium]